MTEIKEIKNEKSNSKKRKDSILIVDDEYSIRMTSKEFLNSKGFVAYAAHMADDALEILNEIEVDLVITNVNMPGMNGLELTRLVKDRYSACVIILTGHQEACTQEDAQRAGADDLLYKPATLEDLLDSINDILAKKNSKISG
jgi:DNA-binding response OmpR family regulator